MASIQGKRILIMASLSDSLINFRGHLIKTLVQNGNQVLCCASSNDLLSGSKLDAREGVIQLGAEFQTFPMSRTSMNPLEDLKTTFALGKIIKRFQPDYVLTYTVKPNIYGSIASRWFSNAKVFSLITGITSGLTTPELAISKKGKLLTKLYSFGLSKNSGILFQNPDDQDWFRQLGILRNQKSVVVNGSGVDLSYYLPSPVPIDSVRFLCIARLLAEKGIREFANAAREVKAEFPDVQFDLVGPIDPQPNSITASEIDEWQKNGILTYHGVQSDVREWLNRCTVFVLPSYREGTPRTVLEAMATGRAIITSDAPGCRQTVVNGFNGYLVPIKDVATLSDRIKMFVQNPALAQTMGKASLEFCKKFNVTSVTENIINFMAEP